MLKTFVSFFFIFAVVQIPYVTAENYTLHCDHPLDISLSKILKIPEARTLLASIQKEGPISFEVNHHPLSQQFGAFWDVENRIVCVNLSKRSEGDVIGSILFEMHNASTHSKIKHLDYLAVNGKISKDEYVEELEYMEYVNSKNASKLAEKGIQLGIFPVSARLHTYRNFDEHFHYQKIGGHSAWIARTFDEITSHRNG